MRLGVPLREEHRPDTGEQWKLSLGVCLRQILFYKLALNNYIVTWYDIVYLTIILRAHVGYEMIDSQQGA